MYQRGSVDLGPLLVKVFLIGIELFFNQKAAEASPYIDTLHTTIELFLHDLVQA